MPTLSLFNILNINILIKSLTNGFKHLLLILPLPKQPLLRPFKP